MRLIPRKKREYLDADLTPLIDIVFLLLIFYMVTSVFKKDEAVLLLTLPTSKSTAVSPSEVKSLMVELGADQLAVNGKIQDIDTFKKEMEAVPDKKIPIELKVDKGVVYQRLVEILEVLQKNSLSNLSLITEVTK